MAFLENKGIMPDVRARVVEKLPFNQTIMLEVKGQQVTLGFASAKYIFVERVFNENSPEMNGDKRDF